MEKTLLSIHESNVSNEFSYDQLLNDNCITLTWRVGIDYTQLHNEYCPGSRTSEEVLRGNPVQQDNNSGGSRLIAAGRLEYRQTNVGRTALAAVH